MLLEKIESIDEKLDQILMIHNALPKWFPLTKDFALECGYKTVDGLRRHCYSHLPPDDFVKKGKLWYVSVRALPHIKLQAS